jgi:arylformamidase
MQNKIIDLTNTLNNEMTYYPGTLPPKFENYNTIPKDGYAEMKLTIPTHTGTHIDAPCHLLLNAKSLDSFPIEKFTGNAIVIPCLNIEEITLQHIRAYKDLISQVDFVLFQTGWSNKWNNSAYFEGFPTLTKKAAQWLSEFNLKGLGFDSISIDKVYSEDLPNHFIVLAKEFIIIENLTNLDLLPSGIFTFFCLPLKIENADGSPVRAIALLHK